MNNALEQEFYDGLRDLINNEWGNIMKTISIVLFEKLHLEHSFSVL